MLYPDTKENILNTTAPKQSDVLEELRIAARAAEDKGGFAQVALEVSENFGLADVFLVISGAVERNVQAISDAIEDALGGAGVRTIRREGRESGRWVLIDFGDLIVHVFHQDERDFYQLEKLWQDAPVIDLKPMLEAPADLQEAPGGGVN